MEASDVPCHELRDRVLRLTPSAKRGSQERRMGPHELADLAKVLRSQGHNVAPHYVMASAGVQKPPPAPIPAPAPTGAVQLTAAAGARSPDRRKPVKVAIIDTGITDEIRTDNFLTTVPREERDIDRLDVFPLPSGDTYLDFAAGHGTFVAGIVQQVAPRADIVVYRAIDSDGIASDVAVACEMIRAVKEGAQIVNLSLSCQTQDNMPPIATQAALEIIREMGKEVLIVAAAGNYADTAPSWPAAFCEVVSVAGLAPDMQPSQWSSRGFWVTFSTIGQGLHSTYVVGQESALVDPDRRTFGKNAWAYWSGTSFAAPQITGRLADRYQHEDISLREALAKLLAEGQAVPDFGRALRILPGI